MTSIHISTARNMLNSGDMFDILLFTSKGELQLWRNAYSISYDAKNGTRRVKLADSRQIRQLRDVLIIAINNITIYL